MTNHARRAGRRKHQRQESAMPTFSDFPCPLCRGLTAHTPACLTRMAAVMTDLTEHVRSVRFGNGPEQHPTRLLIGPAQ